MATTDRAAPKGSAPTPARRRRRGGPSAADLQARRRAARPGAITYPEELPVSQRRSEIAAAIRDHQVVIVAGETGSGKTTQIPKICLELGRGMAGMIGHTQPRRIAARTVAERIAEELHVPLGGAVGYAVRFNDRVGEDTIVKLMTDGILLAELPHDRLLRRYDTIIVDEAHERSLNIDFLLGYLRQLLPRRPDLKVVVTSATIDTAKFAEHFGGAPVIEVTGRTWPVEVRYRPPAAGDDEDEDAGEGARDETEAVCDAVVELCREGPGDILVFLSGEREIRDTAEALARLKPQPIEILPLYARLSAAEQHRVFRPHAGRRVVLATNVAETSITVPGIRGVVDPGTARISRYSTRTKVQRLPIEAISQASANQRAGRCGRVGPGVCIRLYSEEDFLARPAFTEPEILRTSLASVILQMADLRLGPVAEFPFVDPPDGRQVAAGVALLEELGAIEGDRLTALGRRLARLPVDPRMGRMILEADRNGCVREVLVIAAALSIQDPREWPADRRQEAAELHGRFADPSSDFLAYLRLWEHVQRQQRALSSGQFRRLCRRELLHFPRVREWQDLAGQLRHAAREVGLGLDAAPAEPAAVHRSLLAGLLSHIGNRLDDEGKGRARGERARRGREYAGVRGTRFAIGRDSAVGTRAPPWVMAAELVETNRLWARTVARIEPAWVEQLAGHLVTRSYSEPEWDPGRASAVALERVSLYGLPIVAGRRVDYARIDPEAARELFIRHALVFGDWDTHHAFLAANAAAADAVTALEDRVRRRDLLVDDDGLFDLYDGRVPAGVVSGRSFDRWYKDAPEGAMDLSPAMLVNPGVGRIRFDDYPDTWDGYPLTYRYDPLDPDDGVSVHLPLVALNRIGAGSWDWHIPGTRVELVTALLRLLPKDLRRTYSPAGEHARAFLQKHQPDDGPLLAVLGRWTGFHGAWDLDALPPHLRVGFVVEHRGRVLASAKDLDGLRRRLQRPLADAVAAAHRPWRRQGVTAWNFGDLPAVVEAGGVVGYPALVDEGETAGVMVFAWPADAEAAMVAGTRRLLLAHVTPPVARVTRSLPTDAKLALAHAPHPSLAGFLEDCTAAVLDQVVADHGGPPRQAVAWDRLVAAAKAEVGEAARRVVTRAALALVWADAARVRVDAVTSPALEASALDIKEQLDRLIYPGFVAATGGRRLLDLVRYLKAVGRRLDKLGDDPLRDRERMWPIRRLEAELSEVTGQHRPWTGDPDVDAVRWMLEELRVSTWAQSLGTPSPVSERRVRQAIQGLAGAQEWREATRAGGQAAGQDQRERIRSASSAAWRSPAS